MKQNRPKSPPEAFHPFLFVLKEGKEIKNDLLDYSLLLLHISQLEVLKSPNYPLFSNQKLESLNK